MIAQVLFGFNPLNGYMAGLFPYSVDPLVFDALPTIFSIREKKVLYDFACPNHHNTVTRLKWLTALTVDPQAKHRMLELARKMETEMAESWYTGFYHQLRAEMDEYYRAKRRLRLVKENTDYEEDLYDEAV